MTHALRHTPSAPATAASLVYWYARSFMPGRYHAEYIASPAWQFRRGLVLWWQGRRCQMCGRAERLDVHHNNYRRLGRERLVWRADVVVVCRACHALHHGKEYRQAVDHEQ